jgi:lysine 6-dehydrogenase
MKVLSLGGAGAVCRHATRDLAEFSDFEQIIIGDWDMDAAKALAAELDDPRLEVRKVNAENYDELVAAFRDVDVVMNGLPWKYDLPVTRACIEAGVHGLDVSTEKEQWDYDDQAREKELVFIPGVGATPGITNVMARRAADQLDEVDEIQINFAAFRCPAPAPGLLITLLWEFHPKTESRFYYRDGEFHWVSPFEGAKRVNFMGQIGVQEVYYIPHPETRTMPRTLGAKAVSVHGCFPPHVMRLTKAMVESGLYSEEPVTIHGTKTTPFDAMFEILLQIPESKQTPVWGYGLIVQADGIRHGRRMRYTYINQHPPQETWGGPAAYYKNIALPLSIGAQMIARGDVKTPGVIPPETALEPAVFFEELAKRDIKINEIKEELE